MTPWPTVCAIRAWHAEGRTAAEIARGLGMPYSTVQQITSGRHRVREWEPKTAETKRSSDRAYVAAKRNAMNPEERAAARREQDRLYRERHREERRAADRRRRNHEQRRSTQTPAA